MQDDNASRNFARRRWKRIRWAASLFALTLAAVFGRPVWFLWQVARSDVDQRLPVPQGMIDDASGLNAVAIRERWPVPEDPDAAIVHLQELLQRAQDQDLNVSIGGARHSMGGHTFTPGGVYIDMRPHRQMAFDPVSEVLTVGAGAMWHDVLAFLDPLGYSVSIMQSNASFTVGGSVSVNCHGWQLRQSPIASTVVSMRVLKADGALLNCSRRENPELFSAAVGGYGLFGVILDVQLRCTANVSYHCSRRVVPTDRLVSVYRGIANTSPSTELFFARLDVSEMNFLQEALIYTMTVAEDRPPQPLEPRSGSMSKLRRSVFLGSTQNDYGKRLRWDAETKYQALVAPSYQSRSQLLSEGVEIFENRTASYTHVLHEYFIPSDEFGSFVEQARRIISGSSTNLLNVTVRSLAEDEDTFLRYADDEMLSLVMLFSQGKNADSESSMRELTKELIGASIDRGGRYYLPYRLHATREQFQQAYPMAADFFRLKKRFDPDERFVNQFYLKYGQDDVGTQTN